MTFSSPADSVVRDVLSNYNGDIGRAIWTSLGNAGGFSGARLWRGQLADGQRLCLRAWPSPRTTVERLHDIHRAMQSLSVLPFVPRIWPTTNGATWVEINDVFWEVTSWLPGVADFHQKPTDARLFAAMRALAGMHDRLRPSDQTVAPCPAVKRIVRALCSWRDLLQNGWTPDFRLALPEPIPSFALRAWQAISADTYSMEFTLVEWQTRPLPLQYCLCDIWHDHILYEREAVVGVIDYGAVKPDCVAVDLARLLGSMIPDQPERMQQALAIYSAIHPVPGDMLKLCAVLDRAGSVIGLTNWLRWLYFEKRAYSESAGVAKRMEALLKRVEMKKPTAFNPWTGW